MNQTYALRRAIFALAVAAALPAFGQNVLQPGDPIVASSSSSPPSEGVANAIDGKTTKYLNFDTSTDEGLLPSGFVATPSIGVTRVTGMRIQSANDAEARDPKTVILSGSNADAAPAWDDAGWADIATITVPNFTARFEWQSFSFPNFKAYKHYRWTVTNTRTANDCCMQVAEVELLGGILPPDVTQPGDVIVASSSSSPPSEGVANAIDNKTTKYLNFDTSTDEGNLPSGFVVSPTIGRTVVTGMTIQSANDAEARDPKTVILSGSNADAAPAWDDAGAWTEITTIAVPDFTARFQTQTFLWDNVSPYKHYRWNVPTTRTANDCCMQVAEVELLGTGAPVDVTQPGDAIIASSSSSPPSEGVANAIDNKTTKYLNFDTSTDEGNLPSGFVVTPSIGATIVTGMSIQSANDAEARDPKTVILEGSNDDTITAFNSGTWEPITTITVPDFTARFQTQEFFFLNNKPYKHYRWTVNTTRTANDCCMQVAEVELLAVPAGVDCAKTRFLTQPVDTLVLEGSSATFFTVVNGPWPLRWLKNGEPIPGAVGNTYTTTAITPANASDIYSVQIVGCEVSSEVRAVIFIPSATKSVAINFTGGNAAGASTANGAPTLISPTDVIGLWPQAYWNNGPEGAFDLPGQTFDVDGNPVDWPLKDSDGNDSTMTVNYQTSGSWGSGTGVDNPTARMLNGIVIDNPDGQPSTITFNNVPAGNHTVLVYGVSPPLQVQNINYSAVGANTQTYYLRQMNSDEYNAAPGWYRGSSTDANARSIANYVRFENVQPADGVITINFDELTTGYDRGTGPSGVQLLLNAASAGTPPAITTQPQPTVAAAGSTATLTVVASGEGNTYQWRKNGRNLPNGANISGATTSTLRIADFSEADAGVYNVAVFNAAGSLISANVALGLSEFDITDRLVGHWKMDETSGSVAANSVAGGSPGNIIGTATWGAGKIAGALSLDGSTYVLVDNYTKAKAGIAGSAWVNIDPGTAADVAIFRNAQGALSPDGGATRIVGQFDVGLILDPNDGLLKLTAAVGNGPSVPRVIATTAFPTDGWHHIAFSADGAQLRLYVDGQQVDFTDYQGEINPPSAGVNYISMGARLDLNDDDPTDGIPGVLGPDLDAPNMMFGQLDDVAVWTRSLSAQEVGLIYAAGNAGNEVTSVIIPDIPQDEPTLAISKTGTTISVTFDGGKLQSTADLANPNWQDVTNPTTSPYTEDASTGNKYFRAIVP